MKAAQKRQALISKQYNTEIVTTIGNGFPCIVVANLIDDQYYPAPYGAEIEDMTILNSQYSEIHFMIPSKDDIGRIEVELREAHRTESVDSI